MANYEATKYNFSGANLTDIEGVNTGIIIPWGDTSPPSGFLECDGSAVSRTTYATLFAVVGTTYGAGDGSTTFNLPDLQDKLVQGRSPTVNLATDVGSSSVPVTGNVSITVANTTISTPTMAAHTHGGAANSGGAGPNPDNPDRNLGSPRSIGNAGGGGAHGHTTSSANFTGGNISPEQASLVLMYVIKT